MQLKIYTKPGCPLCEEALDLLDDLSFTYETVNICEDPALFDRYRYRVPVVRVGDRDVLELKFTREDVERALK
jgi:glutaredoxin